jgi:hypothetical protein
MQTTVDAGTNLRYGLCLAAQSLPCGGAGWGHEGGLFGCETWALSSRDGENQVVMIVNAHAVVAGWRRGDLLGLRLGGLTAEEALALERLAMTYVRAQLGDRLQGQLARADRRWRHPSSGRRAGDRCL